MPLRAAVNEGEGKKPEVEPRFTDLLFPEVLHFGDQNLLIQRVPRATKGRMGISGICCGDRDTNGRPQKAEYRGAQYGGIRGGWFRPSKGGSLSITNNQAEGRRIV